MAITVKLDDLETDPKFSLVSAGPAARVPPKFLELHSGRTPEEPIDAHSIQPYYTLLLAKEANMEIKIHVSPEEVTFGAAPRAAG